jgi:hypothetical protein
LSLFEERDGWRYQAFVTNTPTGQLGFLEARHRAHARVEDRIRHAKDSGLGRFPSRDYQINQAWLTATAIAADLTAWLRLLALTGQLATAEPKAPRYRLLHVPARLSRSARRRHLGTQPLGPGSVTSSQSSPASRPSLYHSDQPSTHDPRNPENRSPAVPAGACHAHRPTQQQLSQTRRRSTLP